MVLLAEGGELRREQTIIMDWVDTVADHIFLDAITSQDLLIDESGELWETISAASVEDLDHADALDMSDYLVAETVVVTQAPREETGSTPHSPSRSSTPSRSVRNRRRVIGAVRPVSRETAWESAAYCQFKISNQAQTGSVQISPMMKRQASAPAIALDLDLEPSAPTPTCSAKPTATPKSSMSALAFDLGGDAVSALAARSGRQTPSRSVGAKIAKSQSTGTFHVVSSNSGLGLSLPALSQKQGSKGVLPVLSDLEKNRKSELIAWSMNMAGPASSWKRGGLRSVF
jgi:hypothetical protein